jgi:PEP-CTERM motif
MKTACFRLALLLASAAACTAQIQPIDCLAGITPPVPTFSLSSTIGVVADYTLFCSAGLVSGPTVAENVTFFLNTTALTAPWALTEASNTYVGTRGASNEVFFLGVAFDTSKPTLSFEIHGMEVDPSTMPPGFLYLEDSSVNGPLTLNIVNDPIQLVGVNAAPEPSTFALVGLALAAATFRRRSTS